MKVGRGVAVAKVPIEGGQVAWSETGEVNGERVFAEGGVRLGRNLWQKADAGLIDNGLVNGSARVVEWVASKVRRWQTGFLYDYAFAMIIGLIGILAVWVAMVP